VARKCAISRILSQQRQFAMGTNAIYCDNGHNSQCQKKSQMLKPDQLFQLPVDKARKKERAKPKSTREQMESFHEKYKAMTVKKTLK